MFLIKNGTIATLGSPNRVLENHAILIQEGKVTKIAPCGDFKAFTGKVIDARGKVVMPGLINAHMHFYSTLVRGLGKAKPSSNFNEVLENLWWRLDKKLSLDDCYISAVIPLIDAIRKGTTTIIDHHASPGAVRGSLDVIAKAVKETGLRASLCYELSDRDGEKVAQEGLEENIDFLRRCEREKDEHLKGLFGLHASFTVSDRTLTKAVEAAHDLNAGFHVHTAEGKSDQEHCLKEHGMRVVERFQKMGVLGPRTICAHCVHINEHEMELLASTGTNVVHNPQSNMNNAVGVADVIRMTEKGVRVGLGTDAMTVNMLAELRVGLWAQKLSHGNPGVGFMEILNALAVNNAKIADRYWNLGIGEIREGGPADIILIDYQAPTPLNEETFLGHLGFGLAESSVDTTICGGRILMENRQLKLDHLDEERIAARSRELAEKLWQRF